MNVPACLSHTHPPWEIEGSEKMASDEIALSILGFGFRRPSLGKAPINSARKKTSPHEVTNMTIFFQPFVDVEAPTDALPCSSDSKEE